MNECKVDERISKHIGHCDIEQDICYVMEYESSIKTKILKSIS